ncbi:major facilitator superfamily domain-containing protein [Phaeosphaeriaceae sp. PMI808]|nr:major facilitator superfamily domain-containing protein [Phaeosphaeriaceae sp. PMI808]
MAGIGPDIPTHESNASLPDKLETPFSYNVSRIASTEPPPNGGWAAWSQVLGGHIITFFVWGFVTSFGMFQAHYTSIGLSTPSNVSWIGALTVFFLLSVPLWSGAASDTGHFKLVLRMGIALWLIGIFLTSICVEYWQFVLAQGFCIGLANGCLFVPTISVVSTYFDATKRSFALSIVLSGTATGGMVIPIMLNRLISRIGFGWAVRCLGFMALVLFVIAERLMKKRLPPKDSVRMLEPRELKDVVFDLFIFGSIFCFAGLWFAFFYVNAFARKTLGMSLEETIPILMVLNGVGIPGRLLPAYIAGRYLRPLTISLMVSFIISVLLFAWIAIKTTVGMYTFVTLYGLFASTLQAMFPSTLADLTTDHKKMGTRMGMGFALSSFGVLIGGPGGGKLVEIGHGRYLYGQAFAGACGILGFLCFLLAAILHKRKTGLT